MNIQENTRWSIIYVSEKKYSTHYLISNKDVPAIDTIRLLIKSL